MNKNKRQKQKRKAAKKLELESSQLEREKQLEQLNLLLEQAESLIDSFNYEEAEQKLKQGLSIDSNCVKAIEMLAGIQIEKCNLDEAENLLKKCIELAPDTGFSKYFSIAQLLEGEASLNYYQKGIQIIDKEMNNSENVEPSAKKEGKSLTRDLSDAYCSISEIFMTDCCFMKDAETKCFNAIESALKADANNPEAYQCLCNFHLVKEETAQAKEAAEKCLSLWLSQHEAIRDGEADPSAEDNIPSYECRIKISKLLIELEMFDEATKVLDGLTEEDDEIVEVWYLLGWMNYIQGDEYKLNAHYYLSKAKKVSLKTGLEGVDYISHIHELLEELTSTLQIEEEEDDDAQEEVEDGWEDCLSDESENEMET